MDIPRVSVIIPTYNGSDWLAETIASVTSQTFQHYEIIIVDDGSTEPVEQCLPTDYRLRFVRQKNAGTSASRNNALKIARGEYIAFLDHDDKWLPEKLETQVDLLDRYPEIYFVFCDYQSFGLGVSSPNGFSRGILSTLPVIEPEPGIFILTEPEIVNLLIDDLFVQIPSTWMIRKDILQAIGGFEPQLRHGSEDLHLALRLADNGGIAYHRAPMTLRREYSGSLSARSNWQTERLLALNLLWENGSISPSVMKTIFARRKEDARWLARLDIKAERYEEAKTKLRIALEGSPLFEKSTFVNYYYLLKTWLLKFNSQKKIQDYREP